MSSLSLLTCPWDYYHFRNWINIYKSFGLDQAIVKLEFVPKVYLQMMFFLMFPFQFEDKVNKYFSLDSSKSKHLFMQIEGWLQSGNALSKSTFIQIIQDVCCDNIMYNNQWVIDGNIIDSSKITLPTCLIFAKDDKIVPFKSIEPLLKQIKNSTLIKVVGGHIGYLIGNNSDFIQQYDNWLETS